MWCTQFGNVFLFRCIKQYLHIHIIIGVMLNHYTGPVCHMAVISLFFACYINETRKYSELNLHFPILRDNQACTSESQLCGWDCRVIVKKWFLMLLICNTSLYFFVQSWSLLIMMIDHVLHTWELSGWKIMVVYLI